METKNKKYEKEHKHHINVYLNDKQNTQLNELKELIKKQSNNNVYATNSFILRNALNDYYHKKFKQSKKNYL